jgi:hypothetical protein
MKKRKDGIVIYLLINVIVVNNHQQKLLSVMIVIVIVMTHITYLTHVQMVVKINSSALIVHTSYNNKLTSKIIFLN